jgi:quercetin 2,3-dioxygenase
VHFLQIWIVPAERGLPPAYGQHAFDQEAARRDFALLASRDGRDGSLRLHQDVDLRMALVGPGATRQMPLGPERHAWAQVARGSVSVNGSPLAEGDGAALSDEAGIEVSGLDKTGDAEVLLFDLA